MNKYSWDEIMARILAVLFAFMVVGLAYAIVLGLIVITREVFP